MPLSDRLVGVRAKIERAKKHIAELHAGVSSFEKSHPYSLSKEHNPQTGNLDFKVQNFKPVPLDFSLIVGDILNNLRAALDHLAWQLVETNGAVPDASTCFPIFKNANEYKAGRAGKIKGMSQGAVDIIDATKPYQGGNDDLWLLHDLNRIDKHRLLLPVASVSGNMTICVKGRVIEFAASKFKTLEDGAVLLQISPAARASGLTMQMDDDPQFAFLVSFREPEIVKGKPIVPFLHQLAHLIDGIADQFVPFL